MGEFRYIGNSALFAKGANAMRKAVTDSAEDLVGKAKPLTRVDTGAERAGIHVDSVTMSGSDVRAIVATGGASSEYDIYQHEGTYKMSGTKFLERPLMENAPVYREAMARAARAAY